MADREKIATEAYAAQTILRNLESFGPEDRALIMDGVEAWAERLLADVPPGPRGGLRLAA